MTPFVTALLDKTKAEWSYFGFSTHSLTGKWHVVGEEAVAPYTQRIAEYWKVVGEPKWDGRTPQPWSAAFISWCFSAAGAGTKFPYNQKHAIYVDHIRRGKNPGLALVTQVETTLALGDLIWNSRRGTDTVNPPKDYSEAVSRLGAGDFFDSHVEIVVDIDVDNHTCDSIGGNVSNKNPGGSVTRSTWQLDAAGTLIDPRKSWIGVVKNAI